MERFWKCYKCAWLNLEVDTICVKCSMEAKLIDLNEFRDACRDVFVVANPNIGVEEGARVRMINFVSSVFFFFFFFFLWKKKKNTHTHTLIHLVLGYWS